MLTLAFTYITTDAAAPCAEWYPLALHFDGQWDGEGGLEEMFHERARDSTRMGVTAM